MAHAHGMPIRDATLITVFLAHTDHLPRWAGLQRRGQNFSIPGTSDVDVILLSQSLVGFWPWHLHFPSVEPR